MSNLKLNQNLKRIEIKEFEISNEIVFNFFDKISAEERDNTLFRALYIGVLALAEDRLSAFLSKTANELGTELESLKIIFDMKRELFFKSTIKGTLAEEDIANFLNDFFKERSLNDDAQLTGNAAGKIPKNKTGDIICQVNNDERLKIVIECKFDKSLKLGDIESKEIFTRKADTAWSQLLEAQANREGKVGIIVFDKSVVDNSVLSNVENVKFYPAVGFVVIIDSQKGDYTNLSIAYMLARDIVAHSQKLDFDKHILSLMINRIIKDIGEILNIKQLVQSNIEINKKILLQLDKSLLLMEFNQKYLSSFLKEGTLSKDDLLRFYGGDEIKDRYKQIEKDVIEIAG